MISDLIFVVTVLPIKAGQWSITASHQPLTTHIYHVMIIVTSGFSRNLFIIFYFLEILSNDLELVLLEFKHIYKLQKTSLFPFYLFIFYSLFRNHSVY